MEPLNDPQIRRALKAELRRRHAGCPETMIVEELGVAQWGRFFADLAVINGRLEGYEIKSDADTLARLPAQAAAFSPVFERMTLVSGRKHLEKATQIVPAWWTVWVAEKKGRKLSLSVVREGSSNPSPDPLKVCELVWLEEAKALLRRFGLRHRVLGTQRATFWRALAAFVPYAQLAPAVCETIRARGDWRS